MQLRILHTCENYIAIFKPPGLLVHRTKIDKHETVFALQITRDQIGKRVWPVHRLDKATSGVLLFALSPDASARASAEFSEQKVHKEYLAVVRGVPQPEVEIDHALDGKESFTRIKTLASVELDETIDRYKTARYALVSAVPGSGRTHQIRRHLKHISHPIIGDTRYGKGNHNRFFRELTGKQRLYLFCQRIGLPGLGLDIYAGNDADLTDLQEKLNWQY